MVGDLESRLIGKRLKLIRNIINEGGKLSVEQFAFVLQESGDKMRNYELGRAALPNRVLQTLHLRGFNITFLVTGEGDVFNNSNAGIKIKKIVNSKGINLTELWESIYSEINVDEFKKAEVLKLQKEADKAAKDAAKENAKINQKEEKKQVKIAKVAAGNMLKSAAKATKSKDTKTKESKAKVSKAKPSKTK
jgi:L-fucose mutarotase/ribose pyranase (RbsD/FucU family)